MISLNLFSPSSSWYSLYIYIYTHYLDCIHVYIYIYVSVYFFAYTYHSFSLSVIISTGIFMIGICSPRSLWKAEKNSGLRRALNHLHLLHLVASMDFQIFLTTFVIVSDPLTKFPSELLISLDPLLKTSLKWPFAPVKLRKGHLESPGRRNKISWCLQNFRCCYRCWLRSNMAPSGN